MTSRRRREVGAYVALDEVRRQDEKMKTPSWLLPGTLLAVLGACSTPVERTWLMRELYAVPVPPPGTGAGAEVHVPLPEGEPDVVLEGWQIVCEVPADERERPGAPPVAVVSLAEAPAGTLPLVARFALRLRMAPRIAADEDAVRRKLDGIVSREPTVLLGTGDPVEVERVVELDPLDP